jgi:hypothetical protein
MLSYGVYESCGQEELTFGHILPGAFPMFGFLTKSFYRDGARNYMVGPLRNCHGTVIGRARAVTLGHAAGEKRFGDKLLATGLALKPLHRKSHTTVFAWRRDPGPMECLVHRILIGGFSPTGSESLV